MFMFASVLMPPLAARLVLGAAIVIGDKLLSVGREMAADPEGYALRVMEKMGATPEQLSELRKEFGMEDGPPKQQG